MSAPVQGCILDTLENTILGMHSGIPPTLLTRQHVAFSVNATHRGGKPKTRSALVKRRLAFADDESDVNATAALFQRASYYSGFGNNPSALVALIGGRLFRYIPQGATANVQDISPAGDINNPTLPLAWLYQGEEFLIVQNRLDLPIFFDGAGSRRSLGPAGNELPNGTVGTYSNGRIVMALEDQRSFIAGDLVYNTGSGTPAYNYRDSILKTNDNTQILAGRSFAIPINAGRINAMFSVAIPDTSLGQGSLQIGTRKSIFGVNLPLDATLWTATQQPTSVVSLPSAGPLSQDVPIVNMDGWYRSRLGIQSYQVGRRDMGTWVQTALSSEVVEVLKYDTDHLLEYASSVQFDNRLLTTCSPYRVSGRGVAHRGLIALDFHNISSLTSRSSPDYDGLWTGIPILQIVEGEFGGVDRCFVFALDSDNKICLYELLKDGAGDFDFDGTDDISIESWVITNALFGLEIYPERVKVPMKKLICADMFFEELAGDVLVDTKYRSDAYPFWNDWKNFSMCATTCAPPTCDGDCSEAQYQYATFKRLPDPADTCNAATGRLHRTGYYFQMRIQWIGHAAIDKVLVWALPIGENIPGCPTNESCVILQGRRENYFTYEIEPTCSLRIVAQPAPVTNVVAGATINLEFSHTGGTGPFTIQWFKGGTALVNGGDISGATSATLAIANAAAEDAGTYYAVVTDTGNPDCVAQTSLASVTVGSEVPIIWNDGGTADPPDCPNGAASIFTGSYYTDSWGDAGSLNASSLNPNSLLTAEEQACAKTIHMMELNDFIATSLTPSGQTVSGIVTYWQWHPGNVGNQKQLYNKVYSDVCDPFNPDGDWFALTGIGAWTVSSYICIVPPP